MGWEPQGEERRSAQNFVKANVQGESEMQHRDEEANHPDLFFFFFFFCFVPLYSFEAGRLALAQVFWFSSFCASTELGWQLAHEASVPMVISGRLRTGAYLA
jgi:hypothetical protein